VRALACVAGAVLVATPAVAAADGLWTIGAGYAMTDGNEPGVLDGMAVAYPYARTDLVLGFEAEIDDMVATDRGNAIGLRFDGRAEIALSHDRAMALEESDPLSGLGAKGAFFIGGGTLLPITRRGALRVDGHASLDFGLDGTLALELGVRARRYAGRSVQRLQYDVRPVWLGDNRLEHELSVAIGAGGFGVRAQAALGDERTLDGGYRYHTLTFGVEVVR
jgi:hypothetical protein